jgi:hypothetical protein
MHTRSKNGSVTTSMLKLYSIQDAKPNRSNLVNFVIIFVFIFVFVSILISFKCPLPIPCSGLGNPRPCFVVYIPNPFDKSTK